MKSPPTLGVLLLTFFLAVFSGQGPAEGKFEPVVANLRPPPAGVPSQLRIVSFNVHYALDPLKLAGAIRTNEEVGNADVFLIQEIEDYSAEGSSRTAKLAEALGLNYVYAPARTTGTGGTHGLAILSRYPLRDIEVILLPQFNLRYRTRQRIALTALVDVGPVPLRLYNLHLDTRLNPGDRREQLRPIAERAARDSVARVIVGGDFNTSPFRWLGHVVPIFRSSQATAVDAFMQEHGLETSLQKAGSTSRRGFFRFRLDSIYTRGLQVRASGVARKVKSSDHDPVWIEVSWP